METPATAISAKTDAGTAKPKNRDVGIISMGVILIAAGVFAGCALLRVLIPAYVAALLLPACFVLIGLEILISSFAYSNSEEYRITIRAGLMLFSAIMVAVMSAFLYVFAIYPHIWDYIRI